MSVDPNAEITPDVWNRDAMTISRERRDELEDELAQATEAGKGLMVVEGSAIRALLADSAWRERVEREVRELAEKFDRAASQYRAEGLEGQAGLWDMAADKTRAIVDTGEHCPACVKESDGIVSGGTPHTCMDTDDEEGEG